MDKPNLFALTTTLLLGIGSQAQAQAPSWEKAFLGAFERFRVGLDNNDEDEIVAAKAKFAAIGKKNPNHPIPLAYGGACEALMAGHAFWPWDKISHAERGMEMLDEALDKLGGAHKKEMLRGTPVWFEVHLTAGQTFISLPDDRFHRFKQGKRILSILAKHPDLAKTPPQFQAEVHLQNARIAQQEGDKKKRDVHLKRVAALDPGGPVAARAAALSKQGDS